MVVPSGALGNVAAGCLARRMGLPIRVVAAMNDNRMFVEFLRTGVFQPAGSAIQTLSPSMDIQVHSVGWPLGLSGDVGRAKSTLEFFTSHVHLRYGVYL